MTLPRRLLGLIVCAGALMIGAAPAGAVSTTLTISQVYGAGGQDASATYTNDFVELHNVSTVPVPLNGMAIQTAGGMATGAWTVHALPSVSVPAGAYFLVQFASGGASGSPLPTPDSTGTNGLGPFGGKVALTSNTVALSGLNLSGGATVVDFVGYNPIVNDSETSPTTTPLSSTLAAFRGNGGCTDTDNNSVDFTAATPSPRNSVTTAFACPTSPSGVASASPNTVDAGDPSLLTVTVTPGTSPPSTGIGVVVDLSAIGGSPNQTFFNDGTNGDVTGGDNVFSFNATVDGATPPGIKSLPATINDAQARTGSASIGLTVNGPTDPTGIGSASPSTVDPGDPSLLTITVTPGTSPPSTGIGVVADLSAIGGSASQSLFDDGTHGDVTGSDNVFSFNATVSGATSPGVKNLPVTISDDQLRSGSASIGLTINAPPILNPIGAKTVAEGTPLQFTLTASDPDSPTLSFSAIGLPSGAILYQSTGAFLWTPTSAQAGVYGVTFEVSDGSATDSEQVQITVTDVPADPSPNPNPNPNPNPDPVERQPTTAAVNARPRHEKIKVKGIVTPPQPGETVTITLLEKSGPDFEPTTEKSATLTDAGTFKTKLKRPADGKCAVTVDYTGDADSLPSSAATKSFKC